jgi:hypothetical protein
LLLAEGCLVESLLFGEQMQMTLSSSVAEHLDQARKDGLLSATPVVPVRKIMTVGETIKLIDQGKKAKLSVGQKRSCSAFAQAL